MSPDLHRSILIFGAGGMLGHAMVDALKQRLRNATMEGSFRPHHTQIVGLTRNQCDIADPQALAEAVEKNQPTLVINAAAHTKVDLCEQEEDRANAINGHAVGELAKLARSRNAALVHVSTDFVFDGSSDRPYRTDDQVKPLSAYGRSKLLGEQLLQEHAPERWLIVRTAWVYGRHGANFPRTMVQAAAAGKQLRVVSDQHGSPTYAPDLAGGILRLLDSHAAGIFNFTNTGQTTWFDFARAALKAFGSGADVSPVSSDEWSRIRPGAAPRPQYSVLNLAETEEHIGPIRPWQDGLRDYARAVERDGF